MSRDPDSAGTVTRKGVTVIRVRSPEVTRVDQFGIDGKLIPGVVLSHPDTNRSIIDDVLRGPTDPLITDHLPADKRALEHLPCRRREPQHAVPVHVRSVLSFVEKFDLRGICAGRDPELTFQPAVLLVIHEIDPGIEILIYDLRVHRDAAQPLRRVVPDVVVHDPRTLTACRQPGLRGCTDKRLPDNVS
ncbi:hypothetical protein DSECCO2_407200 [anaerobic digester metagenome]